MQQPLSCNLRSPAPQASINSSLASCSCISNSILLTIPPIKMMPPQNTHQGQNLPQQPLTHLNWCPHHSHTPSTTTPTNCTQTSSLSTTFNATSTYFLFYDRINSEDSSLWSQYPPSLFISMMHLQLPEEDFFSPHQSTPQTIGHNFPIKLLLLRNWQS